MIGTYNKLLNVKVDIYRNSIDNLTSANSWFLEDEEGNSHFKTAIKPVKDDLGSLRGIEYVGAIEGTYRMANVTPYITTGETGEAINATTVSDSLLINEEKFEIKNIPETCMLLYDKLPYEKPSILDLNEERLFHIQIPYTTGDYASIYICTGFTTPIGASTSTNGKCEVMTFINENTIKLNIFDSSDFRSVKIDPPGLMKKVYDLTLILTNSKGTGNQNCNAAIMMVRYSGYDDKDRYVNVGGVLNTNLSKLLSTVTPDVTP